MLVPSLKKPSGFVRLGQRRRASSRDRFQLTDPKKKVGAYQKPTSNHAYFSRLSRCLHKARSRQIPSIEGKVLALENAWGQAEKVSDSKALHDLLDDSLSPRHGFVPHQLLRGMQLLQARFDADSLRSLWVK
jgi:hypothetical protein